AVREHDGQAAEVAQHVVQQHRVGELVGAAREHAGAAVHHEGDSRLLAGFVGRVQGRVVRGDAGVHRVDLQRDGAEVKLALELLVNRVVQVRVDVGDDLDALRVARRERQHVLYRLDAGRLGAVLGHQQGDVDALGGQVVIEAAGIGGACGVVDLA